MRDLLEQPTAPLPTLPRLDRQRSTSSIGKQGNHRAALSRFPIETEHGIFLSWYSDFGLVRIDFPAETQEAVPSDATSKFPKWHPITCDALRQSLRAAVPGVLPTFDLHHGTPFQIKVWLELTKIPLGVSRTYGEISEMIGLKDGSRAVGGACGANPIPVLIPCHRVLASDGRLGGFSGGLAWKRRLLSLEQIAFIE